MLNAIPYLGKSAYSDPHAKQLGLGHYYLKTLTQPYCNTRRNVVHDN